MVDVTQRSFTGGEVSPAVGTRVDLTKYQYGLSLCKNFFSRAQGGVYNRPGFKYINEIIDSNSKSRLIPFVFNTNESYALVFEDRKLWFVREAGTVVDGNGDRYEIDTPFTEDELFRIGYTQTDDVMTLVHPNHPPQTLSRFADNNWTMVDQDFTSNVTPPVGLTSVEEGDEDGGGDFERTYTHVVTAVDINGEESIQSSTTTITLNSLSQTYGIRLSWTAVPDADYYRVYKDQTTATGVYGWIGNSEVNEFVDYNIAPITSDTPPLERNPFDSDNNYPSAVTHFSQRRVYANTNNETQTFFATQTGQLDSLRESIPSRSSDAVTFRIFSNQSNEIRYLIEIDRLVMMTSGAEFVTGAAEDGVFAPETVSVTRQSNNGTAWVQPEVVNDTILYVQEKASRLRDLNYEFSSDRFRGNDLSVFAEHLFEGRTIVDMAYSDEPYSILWVVMSDGKMLGLTYLREQEVLAWHQHDTDGEFESVASVSETTENVIYAVVKRNINGVDKRYVERLESRRNIVENTDGFFVDSGAVYEGVPATTISSLEHLEAKQVVAVVDGNLVKNLTVENGSITLPRAGSKVVVGIPYTSVIETLDIDDPAGTLRGRHKSVAKIAIDFENSRGGFVGPKNEVRGTDQIMHEFKPRSETTNYDSNSLLTYQLEQEVSPQWSRGGGVRIEQRDPFPMAILAVTPDVSIG